MNNFLIRNYFSLPAVCDQCFSTNSQCYFRIWKSISVRYKNRINISVELQQDEYISLLCQGTSRCLLFSILSEIRWHNWWIRFMMARTVYSHERKKPQPILKEAASSYTEYINSLVQETVRLIWGRILDSKGEIFTEEIQGKGKDLSWSQIKMDQNEDLSSLHPVQQVFPVSKDLRLTSCLRVTHFYKTVLNLQRVWDPSRTMKTRHLSGKQSTTHQVESWLTTQGDDSFISDWSQDLLNFNIRTPSFPQLSALNRLTWMQAWWKQKIKPDLFEAQRKGNSLLIENIRFLHRWEAYLYSVDSPNFCIGTNSKRPWHFDLIAPLIYIINA